MVLSSTLSLILSLILSFVLNLILGFVPSFILSFVLSFDLNLTTGGLTRDVLSLFMGWGISQMLPSRRFTGKVLATRLAIKFGFWLGIAILFATGGVLSCHLRCRVRIQSYE